MHSRVHGFSSSYSSSRGASYTESDASIDANTTTINRCFSWSGDLSGLIAEQVSEIKPVIAAELSAAGNDDDQLAERIARKVVLKQLDVTDLDGSR